MAETGSRHTAQLAAVTLAFICIPGFTLIGPAVAADPVTPTSASVVDSSHESSDWQVTDGSVDAKPRKLAAELDHNDKARVVSVREVDGRPVVDAEPVVGKSEAIEVIKDKQNEAGVLSVEVEVKEKMIPDAEVPASTKLLGIDLNDPLASQQWALSKLSAQTAWALSQGAGQTVAVIDTGVGPVQDLSGRLHVGWDAINNRSDGRVDPNGHGTHVSGIIAANANNGVGVAGLAPQSMILPVRVLDSSGNGWSSDIAEGITWAADHGADIINMSLGSSNSSTAMKNAVNYAVSKGITVVAASGNEGNSAPEFPAAYNNVIAVGATTSSDSIASFSSYGSHLDLAAPGQSILSTISKLPWFSSYSGTSMATPHVAAAAALLRSRAAAIGMGSVNVQAALEGTAKDVSIAGWDKYSGHGRIDPTNALNRITQYGNGGSSTPAPAPSAGTTLKASVVVKRKKITIKLNKPVSRKVVLQKKSGSKWKKVSTKRTNSKGVTSFGVKTALTYRIQIPGVKTTGALKPRKA